METITDLPAFRRAADLLPATLDEGDRSIDVVWSTGARVRRQPFFGEPFDEELSMDPGHVRLERLKGSNSRALPSPANRVYARPLAGRNLDGQTRA